ncbi:hypothetical protein D3C81_1514090 [compost metagenome]
MGSVTEQEQLAVLHRLDHIAAQRRDALLQGRASHQPVGHFLWQTRPEFIPEALIGPVFCLVGQRYLQVVTAAGQRALAAQGETTVVVGVDQLVIHRRRVGQQPQPAERVHALEVGENLCRNAFAGDTVVAIAAGDVVAVDAMGLPLFLVGDVGVFVLHPVGLHVFGAIDNRRAVGTAGLHQVTGNFGLAIDHDGLAAGQCLEVNMDALAANQQLDTIVNQAFGIHALGHTRFT